MLGGLSSMAAPMVNAATPPPYCPAAFGGKSYAFLVTGAEPTTASVAAATTPENYIAGVGVLSFAAKTCVVSGEMIYIDGDISNVTPGTPISMLAGPAACYTAAADPGSGGVPCFDGSSADITGAVGPGPNGAYTLALSVTFPFVAFSGITGPADPLTLPLMFTVFNAGTTLMGNSNVPLDPYAAGPITYYGTPPAPYYFENGQLSVGPTSPVTAPAWPAGPVLSFTAQAQTKSGTIGTAYGLAPYLGQQAILCTGFGANSNDLVAAAQSTQPTEPTGTYGATSGSLTMFSTGVAYGSLTFNSNDDIGNTTGISNYDCDFQQVPNNAYANGTTNNQAILYDENFAAAEPTSLCYDADAGLTSISYPVTGSPVGANEVNSSVVWGSANQNTYTIVTGLASASLIGGVFIPPGEMATCTGLQESAKPGTITPKVTTAALTDAGIKTTVLITAISEPSGNTVSATLASAPANLAIGSKVIISGVTCLGTTVQQAACKLLGNYNGTFTVTGVSGDVINYSAIATGLNAGVTGAKTLADVTYPQANTTTIVVTNASEGACTVGAGLELVSGTQTDCSISMSPPQTPPLGLVAAAGAISEGGSLNNSMSITCTCTSLSAPVEKDSYALLIQMQTNPSSAYSAGCLAAATPDACCAGYGSGTCTNQFCTASTAPYPCCTGLGTGTCVSNSGPCPVNYNNAKPTVVTCSN